MKTLVAMSGGVDSSVAAALLKDSGHEVTGITMLVGTCGTDTAEDARRVAAFIGIRHRVADVREMFAREVIDNFYQEYVNGRTPNPCIRCNRYIKFNVLLEEARQIGADFIATGHYARLDRESQPGWCLLKKGRDNKKDQSYFLYRLTREQLCSSLFPVGGCTKEQVKEMARQMGLPAAHRPESQEICFVPGNDYAAFIRAHAPQAAVPGKIVDRDGIVIGQHRGIHSYTIGQRRGLGIAAEEPFYVIAIDAERNTLVAGRKDEIYSNALEASGVHWTSGEAPAQKIAVKAKIRHRHPETDAAVETLSGGLARVFFDKPQMAVTPGQAVVFYDGDVVLGGGTIEKAWRRDGNV